MRDFGDDAVEEVVITINGLGVVAEVAHCCQRACLAGGFWLQASAEVPLLPLDVSIGQVLGGSDAARNRHLATGTIPVKNCEKAWHEC